MYGWRIMVAPVLVMVEGGGAWRWWCDKRKGGGSRGVRERKGSRGTVECVRWWWLTETARWYGWVVGCGGQGGHDGGLMVVSG